MPRLSSHVNVWETCLQLLERRGYALRVVPAEEEGEPDEWYAEKDGYTLLADTPVELLGLAAVYEDVRPEAPVDYWWRAKTDREAPRLLDRLRGRGAAG
ncbi:hypothetical protein [Kitasatospora sp. MMS16-BH015]|uniref:hypothetical protein n=1 Tax=Kitasatospora sp. MMS16-BH015 TaxID=2018025 RepID=UPI000CF21B3F|nr:hypothetical protein [Kitasatospora sp. MMS16-BH015]